MRLPFNNKIQKLVDSCKGALRILYSLRVRLLDSQMKLRQQCKEFISEYKQSEHMIAVQSNVLSENFHLPHHAVVKVTSNATKVRIVFDVWARSTNGVFLNDALLVGPIIQDDIFEVVARFRLHDYVLTTDIKKIFQQIKIHSNEVKTQKIVRGIVFRYTQEYQLK